MRTYLQQPKRRLTQRLWFITIVIVFACTFNACSNTQQIGDLSPQNEESLNRDLRLSAATSLSAPNFRPSANSSFLFNKNISLNIDDHLAFDQSQVALIRRTLVSEITTQKHYVIFNHGDKEFSLDVHLNYGNDVNGEYLLQKYNIAPDLSADDRYEKGTLTLMIRDRSRHIVWRGAIQIYGNAGIDPQKAKKRIQAAIATLVSHLPDLN